MSIETVETDLIVAIEGRVIDSNFDEWCGRLKDAIKSLNYELVSDEDFSAADANVKQLKEAEGSLKDAKEKALEQAQEVQKLFAAIDDVSGEARQARLSLERQIKKRKDQIRAEIFDDAIKSLNCKRPYAYQSRLEGAMKGKRTFDTLRQAAESEAAIINAELDEAHAAIEVFVAKHGAAAVPDMQSLEVMPLVQLETELERRAERIAAEAEARRLREEAERLRREAAVAKNATTEPVPEAKQDTPKPAITPESHPVAPSAPAEASARQEADSFISTLRECFASAKQARSQLTHPHNIASAERFATALSAAWAQLMEEML